MTEDDVSLGPGTDLVISLFAVALLMIGFLVSLYSVSVEREISCTANNAELLTDLKTAIGSNDPQDIAKWAANARIRLQALQDENVQLARERGKLQAELAQERRNFDRFLTARKSHRSIKQLEDENLGLARERDSLIQQLEQLTSEQNLTEHRLRHQRDALQQENRRLTQALKEEDDSEEVIRFRHQDGNRFQSGSFDLNETFRQGIETRVINRIGQLAGRHGTHRLIVEVFGFTDGEPLRPRGACTMDRHLVVFNRGLSLVAPTPCSNTDLGKLRADAVAKHIREQLVYYGLSGVRVLGYSAGQTVGPNDELVQKDNPNPDPTRRFVDVRFRIKQDKSILSSHWINNKSTDTKHAIFGLTQ